MFANPFDASTALPLPRVTEYLAPAFALIVTCFQLAGAAVGSAVLAGARNFFAPTIYASLFFAVAIVFLWIAVLAVGFYFRRSAFVRPATALFWGCEFPALLLLVIRAASFDDLYAVKPIAAALFLGIGCCSWLGFASLFRRDARMGTCSLTFILFGSAACFVHLANFALMFVIVVLPGFFGIFSARGGLGVVVFFTTCALLVIVTPWLHFASARSSASTLTHRRSHKTLATFTVVLAVASSLGSIAFYAPQHQRMAFAALANVSTPEQREFISSHTKEIKSGLVNSYLASKRYQICKSDHFVRDRWEESGMPTRLFARPAQELFFLLARPFVYDGFSFTEYSERDAAGLYEKFFDSKIQRAEKEAILRAVKSRLRWDSAGFLQISEKHIHLEEQRVIVTEHGGVANITILDVLKAHNNAQQEAVYYFALPEDAAVTGLWLSDTANERQHSFRVEPRGIARRIYEQSVVRVVDPALVEQVGLQQYKLRVFPVESHKPLFMWLEFSTFADESGTKWPMPQLLERRNVYWDTNTKRFVNGALLGKALGEEMWTVPFVGRVSSSFVRNLQACVGESDLVEAVPVVSQQQQEVISPPFSVAVVLDRSFSMQSQRLWAKLALFYIETSVFAKASRVDVVLTASPWGGEKPKLVSLVDLQPKEAFTCFGGNSLPDMLSQFAELAGERIYDLVLVLTDKGSSGISAAVPGKPSLLPKGSSLWLVHLDGFSPSYDDAVSQLLLSSSGGISKNAKEAVTRWEASRVAREKGFVTATPQLLWKVDFNSTFCPLLQPPPPPKAIATKKWVDAVGSTKATTNDLDPVHRVAAEAKVVTLFSSMVVPVEQWQFEELEKAQNNTSRFDRSHDDGTSYEFWRSASAARLGSSAAAVVALAATHVLF